MPTPWRTHQSQDKYFRQAKSEGYRARSAYKLQEINRRFHLIRRGATVLDLGAAPGSWSQVAVELVQQHDHPKHDNRIEGLDRGKDAGREPRKHRVDALQGAHVVAVDLSPVQPIDGAHIIRGDITQADCIAQIAAALPDGADAVISDVSPAASGIAVVDHARSIHLAQASLDIARRFLKSNGSFVVKVFQGEDFDKFVSETRKHFRDVRIYRPDASRRESNEHYVIGTNFGSIRNEG